MDLQTPTASPSATPTRLEPVLVRLPPRLAGQLRQLARITRIRQSDYLREAVADLIAKYGDLQPSSEQLP
jgi:predicted DNA-binding protein